MQHAKIHSYPLIIQEIYLDSFGHVNNAAYFTLFEEARWDLITQNGYGIDKIKQTGIGPTILEINIKYLKELHARDSIIIQSQITSYKGKIGRLLQQMLRNNIVCCAAEFTIALFHLQERKLISPTPEWLRAVGLKVSP